ncbi:Prostaglandin E synthase 2 [Glycine max]|nr:Prostaglandin E synthase 2 [Glycine max]
MKITQISPPNKIATLPTPNLRSVNACNANPQILIEGQGCASSEGCTSSRSWCLAMVRHDAMRRVPSILFRTLASPRVASSFAVPNRLLQAALYRSATAAARSHRRRFSSLLGPFAAASLGVAGALVSQEVLAKEPPPPEALPNDVVLYQFEACPFCNKVKAFLDYYDIPYKIVEVNPLSKKEIKWSEYQKVPILMVDGEQLNDSSVIIDKLGHKILSKKIVDSTSEDEETKWRRWVDNHLVHVLSPNIYRNTSEALESFEYITSNGKLQLGSLKEMKAGDTKKVEKLEQVAKHMFQDLVGMLKLHMNDNDKFSKDEHSLLQEWRLVKEEKDKHCLLEGYLEIFLVKYAGAAAMYFVSKKLKKKYNITDERAALYEAAETWVDALDGREFLGGSKPNLADLAVFGVLKPIRYLRSGKDMVEHTRIGEWYARMESAVGEPSRIKA